MKQILAVIISICILLQANSTAVEIALFYSNRDYIAKNLCENRDKPGMKCCGKCYLKKRLANEGKQQAPASRSQKEVQVINLFCSTTHFTIHYSFAPLAGGKFYNFNDLFTRSYQQSVFHPPTA